MGGVGGFGKGLIAFFEIKIRLSTKRYLGQGDMRDGPESWGELRAGR